MNFKHSHILLAVLVLSSSFDSSALTIVQDTKNVFSKIKNSKTAHITALVLAAVALTGLTVFGARQAYLAKQNKEQLTPPSQELINVPKTSYAPREGYEKLAERRLEQQHKRIKEYELQDKFDQIDQYLRAAGANDLGEMQRLEALNPQLPYEKDKFGFTPLMAASMHNALTTATYLAKVMKVNIEDTNKDGVNALMIAALNRSKEVLGELLLHVPEGVSNNPEAYEDYEIGSVTEDIRKGPTIKKSLEEFKERTLPKHKKHRFDVRQVNYTGRGQYPSGQGTTEFHSEKSEEPSGTIQVHDGN